MTAIARSGIMSCVKVRDLAEAISRRWSGTEILDDDAIGRGWWWRPRAVSFPETVARHDVVKAELEALPRAAEVRLFFESAPCRVKVGAHRGGVSGHRAGYGSRGEEPAESFTGLVVRLVADGEPSLFVVVPLE